MSNSESIDLLPQRGHKRRKEATWACGVTTAPREKPTLTRTLESIEKAGFPAPTIFSDDRGVACPLSYSERITQRAARLGAFPNFYCGLTELFMGNPTADYYAMFQDDVRLTENCRWYLDDVLSPSGNQVHSIYTSSRYSGDYCGSGLLTTNHLIDNRYARWVFVTEGWDYVGALAFVFSQESINTFLTSPVAVQHRHSEYGLRCVDSIVGKVFKTVRAHYPSLAQHIGDTSTIHGADYPNEGQRQAANFTESLPYGPPAPKTVSVTAIIPIRNANINKLTWTIMQLRKQCRVVLVDDDSENIDVVRTVLPGITIVEANGRGMEAAVRAALMADENDQCFIAPVGCEYEPDHVQRLLEKARREGTESPFRIWENLHGQA